MNLSWKYHNGSTERILQRPSSLFFTNKLHQGMFKLMLIFKCLSPMKAVLQNFILEAKCTLSGLQLLHYNYYEKRTIIRSPSVLILWIAIVYHQTTNTYCILNMRLLGCYIQIHVFSLYGWHTPWQNGASASRSSTFFWKRCLHVSVSWRNNAVGKTNYNKWGSCHVFGSVG